MSDTDILKDIHVLSESGAPVELSALWRQQPVVLVFVRHFG